jgi:hypothetical protein
MLGHVFLLDQVSQRDDDAVIIVFEKKEGENN